jgi:hypothetical protein
VVGIDVGLKAFAVLSDGTRVEAPKPLAKALPLLGRRSKQLSRKQKQTVVEPDPETGKRRTVFSGSYEKVVFGGEGLAIVGWLVRDGQNLAYRTQFQPLLRALPLQRSALLHPPSCTTAL